MSYREEEILERAIEVAKYIVKHRATIREAAEVFGISKTTAHLDVTERIRYVDSKLYFEVCEVLDYNTSQRSIRGGEVTRQKLKCKK